MSTQPQRVRIPHPWESGATLEATEVDRENVESYNDRDVERVSVETDDGTRLAVRSDEIVEVA